MIGKIVLNSFCRKIYIITMLFSWVFIQLARPEWSVQKRERERKRDRSEEDKEKREKTKEIKWDKVRNRRGCLNADADRISISRVNRGVKSKDRRQKGEEQGYTTAAATGLKATGSQSITDFLFGVRSCSILFDLM